MPKKTIQNLNLISALEATAPCSIETTPKTKQFLNRKTNRSLVSFSEHNEKICSICLENDKYTPSKCIQCTSCLSYCHLECYKQNISNQISLNNFKCQSCLNSPSSKCFLCFNEKGILKMVNEKLYSHIYCMKYFKELQEEEFEIRKWRYRKQCKICHNKDKTIAGAPVLKCNNTKCKNYYHICCAIENGLIFSLSYQSDFYKLDSNEVFPFYCNYHNKNLISQYMDYINDMDCVLEMNEIPKNEEAPKNKKEENSEEKTLEKNSGNSEIEKEKDQNNFLENSLMASTEFLETKIENGEKTEEKEKTKEILGEIPEQKGYEEIELCTNEVNNNKTPKIFLFINHTSPIIYNTTNFKICTLKQLYR